MGENFLHNLSTLHYLRKSDGAIGSYGEEYNSEHSLFSHLIRRYSIRTYRWNLLRLYQTVPVRRRWTRTVKLRSALSRPCPAGQTDIRQLFSKIRTESGQQTESKQTKTGQTPVREIRTPVRHWTDSRAEATVRGLSASACQLSEKSLSASSRIRTGISENPDKTTSGKDTNNAVRRRLVSDRTTPGQHHCS